MNDATPPDERSLIIDERITDSGATERVALFFRDGALVLRVGTSERAALPLGALATVMARYGKPLAPEVARGGPSIDAGGNVVEMLRYRPRYDVIAKDYLVYSAPGREPLAALAVTVTAALLHLADAAGRI